MQEQEAQGVKVEEIETVTDRVDTEPEPVGGLAAIQAAVQQPEEVWKENQSGTAVVEARISSNGRVSGTRVVNSSGFPGMDSEAMLAVARVIWKPGRRRGVPIETTVQVQVHFAPSGVE